MKVCILVSLAYEVIKLPIYDTNTRHHMNEESFVDKEEMLLVPR